MTRLTARIVLILFASCFFMLPVSALQMPNLPDASGAAPGEKRAKVLNYPYDLRAFRTRALGADGYFAPDIAFSVHACPKCRGPYVFGVYPRLNRAPFDSLQAVRKSLEDTLAKPTPATMYSPRLKKMIPRACPYCGEPERDAHADAFYFCHPLLEIGDDLHIDFEVKNGKLGDPFYWHIKPNGSGKPVPLAAETEAEFFKTFGCHFSIRAVWNDIFNAHWNDDVVHYENVAPGMWLIFRPEKVSDAAFKEFAEKQLGDDKKKGLFDRLESVLQIDKNSAAESNYTQWATAEYAAKLASSKAECFVGISLSEMRSIASAAAASRGVSLNIAPTPTHVPGNGFFQRGKLHIPLTLAPLTKLAAISGLSLHQAASYYLGDGCFKLEAAEKLSKKIESVLPDCDFAYRDGGTVNIRDKFNEIRSVDLFALSSKLNPDDELLFTLYSERLLRWDVAKKRFGPPPLDREISPIGLPAFVERRIRPAEHLIKHNASTALFEPFFDSDGKRCDLCYTNECTSTVVFIDPQKPQFKDIPDVNTARRFYFADGGTLPLYIEALDVLRFPGGIPGLVECPAVILCGSDVSSLASEAERASALAVFADLPDVTKHVHLYAYSTNCAAVAPRKLTQDEQALLKSRMQAFLKSANTDPGLELNLYFDLPRAKPKGKVVRRKN